MLNVLYSYIARLPKALSPHAPLHRTLDKKPFDTDACRRDPDDLSRREALMDNSDG